MIAQTRANELHLIDLPFNRTDSIARANGRRQRQPVVNSLCGINLAGQVEATNDATLPPGEDYPDWVCTDCVKEATA